MSKTISDSEIASLQKFSTNIRREANDEYVCLACGNYECRAGCPALAASRAITEIAQLRHRLRGVSAAERPAQTCATCGNSLWSCTNCGNIVLVPPGQVAQEQDK